MSLSCNDAIHYLTVMYFVFKSSFSLGSLFNTILMYNEQEKYLHIYLWVFVFSFGAGVSQSFYVLTKAKNVPLRGKIQPV